MPRSTRIAIVIGALLGATLGLGAVALAAGRVLVAGIGFDVGPAPSAAFVVGQAGAYLFVAVAGAVGGAVTGLAGYAAGGEADPDTTRFGPGPSAVVAAGLGAVVAFAVFRAAGGLIGDIVDGQVILSVFRAIVVALIGGAATGAVCAGATERFSRPEAFGFAGHAWPASPGAFVRDAAAAVGLPLLGLVLGGAAVYLFSQVLLGADTEVATILFGAVAALILFGAAVFAAIAARRSRKSVRQ